MKELQTFSPPIRAKSKFCYLNHFSKWILTACGSFCMCLGNSKIFCFGWNKKDAYERTVGESTGQIGLCFSNKIFCLNQYIFIMYFMVLGVKPRVSCMIWQMLCHLVTSYSPTNKYFLHPDEYTRELTCLWGLCLIGECEMKYELLWWCRCKSTICNY